MKKLYIFLVSLFLYSAVLAESLRPEPLVFYDKPGATVLLVDKSECSVNVYRYQQEWKMLYRTSCTTGKSSGDKVREGDRKTPTGVYTPLQAWNAKELHHQYGPAANIYGVGAFELNYPNYLDLVLYQKNGSGIWIHGTDKKIPEATNGCVATSNENLKELAPYIEIGQTPVIIEERINFINEKKNNQIRQELTAFVETWRKAWEAKGNNEYLKYYAKEFRTPDFTFQEWLSFKRKINERNLNRRILVSDMTILKAKDIYQIDFLQHYFSTGTNDIGKKQIYLTKVKGEYQIISEKWDALESEANGSMQVAYKGSAKKQL